MLTDKLKDDQGICLTHHHQYSGLSQALHRYKQMQILL